MSLELCSTVSDFRDACDAIRASGRSLGLVPTMGALHSGHMALVDYARQQASSVAVSLFVNPTQFGPNEDLSRYPRDLAGDLEKCEAHGVSLIFAPPASEMYASDESTRVVVRGLTDGLCGAARPGHFDGVATIVTKLFAVVGPSIAVFGRKDYQQLKVVQRLVRDLLLPVRIFAHPTVREADGLALSSRNAYLTQEQRQRARAIPRGLLRAMHSFARGERRAVVLRDSVRDELGHAHLEAEYVTLADPESLAPVELGGAVGSTALLALAARIGSTRLIDNVVLGEETALSVSEEGSKAEGSEHA
ncbi:MAG: pantoate--beta-alanine ligase [Polyangiaceae bacterium]|nr:pantoate--beta-alanine ligase [Polyangiaceae bacterium]